MIPLTLLRYGTLCDMEGEGRGCGGGEKKEEPPKIEKEKKNSKQHIIYTVDTFP